MSARRHGDIDDARGPYAEVTSAELGRHWVATRDIAAGEVLLEERPLAVGPKAGAPAGVCLACYAATRNRCSACGWPACGPRCETAAVHRDAECPLIAGHYDPDRRAAYCFVLPLRCMLLAGSRRAAFLSLQSHLDSRLDTPLYRAYAVNVAAYVLDVLGLRRGPAAAGGAPHDERSALEASAVLDTNAFDVRRPGGRQCRALYARASMMAHSCTPNSKHVFVGDAADGWPAIRVVAAVAIARGDPVTATYTQTLWCTRDRRRHLAAAKCFECACARCADPTELGTHMGSAACAACRGGRATAAGRWSCDRCGRPAGDGDGGLAAAEAGAQRLVCALDKTDRAGFEQFLERVDAGAVPPLHADHHVTVNVKYALVQLYCTDRPPGYVIIIICYRRLLRPTVFRLSPVSRSIPRLRMARGFGGFDDFCFLYV